MNAWLYTAIAVSTLSCILSASFATIAARAARQLSSRLRALDAVEASQSDLDASFRRLLESHKTLRSRIGMRELREKMKDEPPATASPAEKKAFFRRKLGLEGPNAARAAMRIHTGGLAE